MIAIVLLIAATASAQDGPRGETSVKPRELSGDQLAARFKDMVDPEQVEGARLATLCDAMDLICGVAQLDGAPGVTLTPEELKVARKARDQWVEFFLWEIEGFEKTDYFAVASIIGEKGARETFAATLPDKIVPGCIVSDSDHNNLIVIDRKNWRQDGEMMLNDTAVSDNDADRKTKAAATVFHECLHCVQENKTPLGAVTVPDQIAFWKSRKKSHAEHVEIYGQERAFALLVYEHWQQLGLSQQPTLSAGNIASNAARQQRHYRAEEKAACDKIDELEGN